MIFGHLFENDHISDTSRTFDKFVNILYVIRSRDISVSLVLQSMTQLEITYTHAEFVTIINDCDHILSLGCQDLETARCSRQKTEFAVDFRGKI